jgi:mercuric reductase
VGEQLRLLHRDVAAADDDQRLGQVVENAFDGAGKRIDYTALPRITFTNPTIASAGLTEAQALEQGIECSCRTLPLEHVPRAIVNRDTRGLVKLVAERESGRIVGVHLVGDSAGDVILAASLAIQTGMTVEQFAGGWNPYLTLGEGLYLAAQSFTRDPSKLSCCAA